MSFKLAHYPNLDGVFNSSDLVQVFAAAEFEDGIAGNSTWEDGDWNCDGEFDSGDLVRAFEGGNYSIASVAAAWIGGRLDGEDSRWREVRTGKAFSP